MREIIISIVIIGLVTTASILTQNYLEKTSDDILVKLTDLRSQLKESPDKHDTEIAKSTAEQIVEKWEETNKNWSMIVVHEELDMIELSLLSVKSCLETSEIQDCLQELEKSIFLVGHIKEKESFRIKNIF